MKSEGSTKRLRQAGPAVSEPAETGPAQSEPPTRPGLADTVKSLIPTPVKEALRGAQKRYLLDRALRRFALGLPDGSITDWKLLDRLVWSWGNEGWSGGPGFLSAGARLASPGGRTLLECGTGLSTVLTGLAAQANGSRLYSLEHKPCWSGRVRDALSRYDVDCVEVLDAPLVSYGDFHWYHVDEDRLPAHGFDGVICDGPPSDNVGGRYGLMPVMAARLRAGCTILLDDAQRDGERAVVERWLSEFPLTVECPSTQSEFFTLTVSQPQADTH